MDKSLMVAPPFARRLDRSPYYHTSIADGVEAQDLFFMCHRVIVATVPLLQCMMLKCVRQKVAHYDEYLQDILLQQTIAVAVARRPQRSSTAVFREHYDGHLKKRSRH